ncbi:MAG: VOC family protein [Pseudomonadota bacterium]
MIKTERIGHVVLKVRDLERSEKFYTEVLGLTRMGRLERPPVVFLASNARDHHELGLLEVGADGGNPKPDNVGLLHVAFRLETGEQLAEAYRELKARGVTISCTVNHGVAKGIYFLDPDGNELELYVDNSAADVALFDNPYAGVEKLEFAPDDPSLIEALQG